MDLGAVTLWLELPQGMEVQNVRCNRPDLNGALVHRQEGSSLGLVWYGLVPWEVKEGEVIFVLEARGKATGSLKVDRAKSELANGWGEVQEAWQWSAPGLRQRGQDQWQITAYPNPFESYMALLREAHRDENLEGVMCRDLLSVDWQGRVYDCDFNQMLGLPLRSPEYAAVTVRDLLARDLTDWPIAVADHCFGCTAGQGSSCGGALGEVSETSRAASAAA